LIKNIDKGHLVRAENESDKLDAPLFPISLSLKILDGNRDKRN
jgi:hypothetical protein